MKALSVLTLSLLLIAACSSEAQQTASSETVSDQTEAKAKDLSTFHKAYFASGCFWCVEAVFESIEGVEEAVSGYSGGQENNPTYKQVSAGVTTHAEAVEVYYDSSKVDFPTLLRVFFASQDPTTVNRQGPDRGAQYRSVAFYQNETEKAQIEAYISKLTEAKTFAAPIVTEVTAFEKFWIAEDYHQNYERLHPDQPYVRGVSVPRLRKFQKNNKDLLKKEALAELESH